MRHGNGSDGDMEVASMGFRLVVSIVSKAHSGSWRQYAKMPKAGMPGVQLPEQIQYHGCVIAVVLVLSYLYLA